LRGTVSEFDEAKGYGTVRTDDGRELFFHCTQIADGSRTISVGAAVEFEIVPGHNGRWEAAAVTQLSG
jgi:CspA family cold shock protein